MRVLMTSTSYPLHAEDWRGRFIKDMVDSLSRIDNIRLLLWAPPGEVPAQVMPVASASESAWLRDLLARGGIAHSIRSGGWPRWCDASRLLYSLRRVYRRIGDMDVIHVNWLQNALPLWGTATPAVVTVLGSDFGLLRLPGMTALLRIILRQRKAVISPNAEWMIPELEHRFGDIARITAIPFGVEARWFRVQRNPQVGSSRKWVVVSRVTSKKIGPLFSWGESVFGDGDELHLFGPMQEPLTIPEWVHFHGPTHPDELCNEWFPKVTALLTLSQHDEGRPQVILEAMAARIPILASDIPAHRNLIQHQETGWLTDSRQDFLDGLRWLSDHETNIAVGLAAQEWVKQEVGTWDDCAGRIVAAYRWVLGSAA